MRRALPLLTFALLALGAGAAPLLRNPQLVATGSDPVYAFASGDFNGDGHTDMLTFSSARSLTAILDNGTGPFAKPVVTPIKTAISWFAALAAGDVNGDGRTDVVAFDSAAHSIVVFFGNIDGTFTPGPVTPAAVASAAVAVGDFNGDHQMDVVLGTINGSSSYTLTTFFGDGSGNFASPSTTVTGDPVWWIAPVDLNGDGKTDVVVSSLSATAIWLSKGDGTFAAGARLGRANVAFGDFNHDGKIDLALAADYSVGIYLGNGDGTVTKSATYLTGGVPNTPTIDGIKTGDVDGDGNLDLVMTSDGGAVSVIRGKADGTFQQPARTFLGDYNTSQIFLSDFDRDGKLDLLMTISSQYGLGTLFSFAHGNGNGTFGLNAAAVTFNAYQPQDGNAVTADVNRDGKPDVVVLEHDPDEPLKGYRIAVLLNDGAGRLLSAPVSTNTGTQGWDQSPFLAMADINSDGIVDAVVLSNPLGAPAGESLLGNGDGTFGAPIHFSIPAMGRPHLADFDGDGVPDLLFSAGTQYVLQHGNGNGTFAAGVITELYYYLDATLLLADLNGDGKMDFVATHSGFQQANSTSVFLNDGKGNFTGSDVSYLALAVSDFNNDGKPDLLLRYPGGIQVRLGKGDGTFGSPIGTLVYFSSDYIRPTVAADFNGDGYMDVAIETSIYLGRGDGTFSSGSTVRAYFASNFMAADLDGNGSSDLLFKTRGAQIGIVLTNLGDDPTTPSSTALTTDQPTPAHQTILLTATVTGGATPLSGMVAFAADAKPFAIIPVGADGKASMSFTLPTGTASITATYSGDEYYRPSTASMSLNVSKVGTTVVLSPDTNPQAFGLPINLYGYVGLPPGPPIAGPTGLIIVHEGSFVLGTIRASGAALKIQGGTLSVGTHLITADYTGDTIYKPSTTTYTQVVSDPTPRKRAVHH